MEITAWHYKADRHYSENYFTIEEHADFCNVDFKKTFARFIEDLDFDNNVDFLYGVSDLNITEQLHHKGILDVTKVEKVFVLNSLIAFKEQVEKFYEKDNADDYHNDELPFSSISIREEEIEGHTVYIASGVKEVIYKGFYVSQEGEISISNPEIFAKYFLSENLYCKRADFERLYQLSSVEDKAEIMQDFLNCFIEGKSILYFEYYD